MKKKELLYRYFRIFLFSFSSFFLLASFLPASTQNPLTDNPLLNAAAQRGGYTTDPATSEDIAATIGSVVFTVLSFLGIIFISLIIYGGYEWMTARGNETQVEQARNIIRDSIIGIIILSASYSIWLLIERLIFGFRP